MNNHPIGILDSGVGGLSVWQEITKLLPDESTVYIADSKNIPYGTKTAEEIYTLSSRLIRFLLAKKVKLIVVACNTITVTNIDRLRKDFPTIPIIGTVPVVKNAVEKTKKKKIGILSTINTAQSAYQKKLLEKFAGLATVINKGTNKLVPLVENGEVTGALVVQLLQQELQPFKDADIDVLALGCTHFPFLEPEMKKILGKDVEILDSGAAIARHVQRILEHNNTKGLRIKEKELSHVLYTTGDEKKFEATIVSLVNESIGNVTIMQWDKSTYED